MNSRQRRQLRRQYPYLVITRYRDYGSYLDAWEWLKERYGVGRLQPQIKLTQGGMRNLHQRTILTIGILA